MSDNQDLEKQVVDYLTAHPDFFVTHEELLSELTLPHGVDGTVSLVERQITTLRKKFQDSQTQLSDLIDIARENDSLNHRLHQMTLELFDAATIDDVVDTLQNHLRDQFNADAVEVKLFSEHDIAREAIKGSPGPALFRSFMENGRPKCGHIDASQLEYLFGDVTTDAGSVALVPLNGITISGILAIGNSDPEHFHCGQGTDFLRRLGDIVAKAFETVELPA